MAGNFNWGAASRCICGSATYLSRNDAKASKRRQGKAMIGKRVYACKLNPGAYHLGDLDPAIVAGDLTRADAYGMDDTEKWAREVVVTRAHHLCEVCGGMGYEYSHRQTKAVHAGHQWCPCNGLWSCRSCHGRMHAGPAKAREDGHHVSRFEKVPAVIPVLLSVGWAILDCDGGGKLLKPEQVIHEYGIPRLLGVG
jgi:ribosomal protein L37AE/L43A